VKFSVIARNNISVMPLIAATRLLTLWVRVPPGAWISVVSVVCCQVEVSATSLSLVQKSPTDFSVLRVIYKPRDSGGPDPMGALRPKTKKQAVLLIALPLFLLFILLLLLSILFRRIGPPRSNASGIHFQLALTYGRVLPST
jgi:hypothetical protein